MKKFFSKGFSSILYSVISILCICFVILSNLLLIITEDKKNIGIVIPIFVIIDLSMLYYAYLLYSSIRITIKIDSEKIIVKGQPIRYKNRIQHSFYLNIEKIIKIRIGYDEYNSKGEKFSSLNPRHMYQKFIYFETNDDKVYKIWIKHFSKKQIKNIIDLTNHFIQVNSTKNMEVNHK